jgi:hypothetical protein
LYFPPPLNRWSEAYTGLPKAQERGSAAAQQGPISFYGDPACRIGISLHRGTRLLSARVYSIDFGT